MNIKEFLRNAGSVIQLYSPQMKLEDLFPHYKSKNPDANAIAHDRDIIRKDMHKVIKKYS